MMQQLKQMRIQEIKKMIAHLTSCDYDVSDYDDNNLFYVTSKKFIGSTLINILARHDIVFYGVSYRDNELRALFSDRSMKEVKE